MKEKDYSMISEEDAEKLITPKKSFKKENVIFTKIFGSFKAGKEDNYE